MDTNKKIVIVGDSECTCGNDLIVLANSPVSISVTDLVSIEDFADLIVSGDTVEHHTLNGDPLTQDYIDSTEAIVLDQETSPGTVLVNFT